MRMPDSHQAHLRARTARAKAAGVFSRRAARALRRWWRRLGDAGLGANPLVVR
jgi:hypothetical protein